MKIKEIKTRITIKKMLYSQLKNLTDLIFEKLERNIEECLQMFCDNNDINRIKWKFYIKFKPRIKE